ncbi:TonB-dependent siderophore receptor [Ideonella sp.]|jgi:iron complex outermembrane receptor protein|uniref:TonB-dependent siderophore receptor n=1 Tax=Ideonella sp. TaxID=1929293 RepID=UPI0037BF7546
MSPVFKPTCVAVAVTLLSLGARAQSTEPERVEVTGQRDAYQAPPTERATKTDTPLLLTPQSVQVVPRAVLNDQKALTLTDAVRNVSGVGTDFGFNGSAQPLLILRGFQTTSMTASGSMSGMSAYYVNGVKVMGVPLNMANVDAVEVVKGPASVLYGRSEPGGLVNVVPKALSAQTRLGLEQTFGQYGLSRTLVEGGGALNEEKTLLGRASLSYDKGGSNRDFVENKLAAFSGTLAWVPNAGTRVALTLDHNAQKYRNDFGVPADGNRPANLPRTRQYNDAPELSTFTSDSLVLDAQTKLDPNWTLKGRVVSMRAKTHEVDVWPYRENYGLGAETCDNTAGLSTLCRYYFYVRPDGRVKLDQATVSLAGDLALGGLKHKLLAEVDHYRTEKTGNLYFTQISSVSVFNPSLGKAPALDTSFPLPADDHNQWTSLTLQDQVAFGGGWHGVLALRHDRTDALFSLTPNTAPNKQSFTTPRVGVVWEFAPQQTLYAQYQDSIAANNGRDPATGNALEAERAKQIELGWKQSALGGKLNTTVAVYELVKRNRADFSLYPTVTTIGEARSRGLEVDAIGQVSPQLAMMASYTYLDAKVTQDPLYQGTRLANTARHAGSVWGRWMFDEQWAAGAGIFFQGQRQGDNANSFQLPGFARVDAMASYAFKVGTSSKGSVQFNLKNVFDTVYYTGSHPLVKDWIQPGTPRTASVTLRLDY